MLSNLPSKLDQFFTKKTVAIKLFKKFNKILIENNILNNRWLEPSVGSGSFFNLMPENKLGIDLDVKVDGVIKNDFLKYELPENDYTTLGNPPFGRNSSLAIKFFNKCANHSLIIGFIIPKTFQKESVINKLDFHFHLIYEEELEKNSFEFNGLDYNVPCVFQVWIRRLNLREKIISPRCHNDFQFTTKEKANFAIQRVGVKAGLLKENFTNCASASHYFIIADNEIKEILRKIDWSSVKYKTAGNPSISKTEIVKLFNLNK
jgi:hypothetical protein